MERGQLNPACEDAERIAARAALLDLRTRAAHEITVPRDRIRIAPDPRILSEDEAAAELARRAKPLQCEASVEEDVLVVRCDSLPEDLRALHEHELLDSEQDWAAMGEPVLLIGGEDSLRMPKAAFVRWRRDYVVHMLGWMGGGEATAEQRKIGVDWVWMVGGGRGRTYFLDAPEQRGAAERDVVSTPELPEAMRSLILESMNAASGGEDAWQAFMEALREEDAAEEGRD